MPDTLKLIITSKGNLQAKYDDKFQEIEKLITKLIQADKDRGIKTQLVYIDDESSCKSAGITAVNSVTRKSAKQSVDELYKKLTPAYIVLLGSQDVFPFQEIDNPVPFNESEDSDKNIPSDLPYACEAAYGTKISSFTGPTRVVGRIPDIPGVSDVSYLTKVINTLINHKPYDVDKLSEYFSITANVWKQSTRQSLSNIFGNYVKLKDCPPSSKYKDDELKAMVHFFNCHGAPLDSKFYGQLGEDFPAAIDSPDVEGRVTKGTIVAAECCYGAQLHNPADAGTLSMGSTYLQNNAIAFVGATNIAYGPADGQGLADLITQYFIKNVMSGASAGRALLEARQQFVTASGPSLDPYELKTLGQFYLLGDPAVQPIIEEFAKSGEDTIENRRFNLYNKGVILAKGIMASTLVESPPDSKLSSGIKDIIGKHGFTGKEKEYFYEVKSKGKTTSGPGKSSGDSEVSFRTFIKKGKKINDNLNVFEVLVIKEKGKDVLGWRVYHRK